MDECREEDEEEGSEDNSCLELQREFRGSGWNVAGANLLAVTCWIARQNFLYARPRLTTLDFGVATVVTLISGILVGLMIFSIMELNPMNQHPSLDNTTLVLG